MKKLILAVGTALSLFAVNVFACAMLNSSPMTAKTAAPKGCLTSGGVCVKTANGNVYTGAR